MRVWRNRHLWAFSRLLHNLHCSLTSYSYSQIRCDNVKIFPHLIKSIFSSYMREVLRMVVACGQSGEPEKLSNLTIKKLFQGFSGPLSRNEPSMVTTKY